MISSLSGARPHDLPDLLQVVAVVVFGPLVVHTVGGRLLAASSPVGKLSWSDRRWRNGFTLGTAAMSVVLLIYVIGKSVPLAATVLLWVLLGFGVLLAVRWLWRDWKKEQQARATYFQKLAQEGETYVPPPLTGANKAWRLVLNGYAIVLVVALVYGLIRYLLGKH